MTKSAISSNKAPAAVGSYSQAIHATGELFFCSGQIAIDPATGQIDPDQPITAQTQQVMQNLTAVLTAAGLTWAHVVKTEIFLADMNDFATVNEVYGRYFTEIVPPARQCVEVARLPLDARIEISCIAVK